MSYPSDPQEYPQTWGGGQLGYPGAQGYPPDASQSGGSYSRGNSEQPDYPHAYPPQALYPPQQGAYPPAYAPQAPYPPQQGYASPGYSPQQAYLPQPGYGQPYAQAQAPTRGASPVAGAQGQAKARNPLATRALIYGVLSFGANIVGLFFGFYLTGILAAFTIYYSIRALVYASKLSGKEGTRAAIGGMVLAVLSLLITIFGYIAQFGR